MFHVNNRAPLPYIHHSLIHHSSYLLVTFFLHQVSSAGEEDFGQSESTQITITKSQCKGRSLQVLETVAAAQRQNPSIHVPQHND